MEETLHKVYIEVTFKMDFGIYIDIFYVVKKDIPGRNN